MRALSRGGVLPRRVSTRGRLGGCSAVSKLRLKAMTPIFPKPNARLFAVHVFNTGMAGVWRFRHSNRGGFCFLPGTVVHLFMCVV